MLRHAFLDEGFFLRGKRRVFQFQHALQDQFALFGGQFRKFFEHLGEAHGEKLSLFAGRWKVSGAIYAAGGRGHTHRAAAMGSQPASHGTVAMSSPAHAAPRP